jgi:hypothetical protein
MLRDIPAAIAGKDYEDSRRICQAGVALFSPPRCGPQMIHPPLQFFSAAGVVMVIALSLALVAHFYSNRIGRG